MLFKELGLAAELLRAVEKEGYETATPIQAKAIPHILAGRDILAAAQTGTGKTAGFTLPMLHRMQDRKASHRRIRALILTPTRELAAQVHESVRTYGKFLSFRSMEIYGGVSARPQIAKLDRGVDIVIATPGRLLDHIREGHVDLTSVEFLVLDEADRMLDMGFIRDIKKILKEMPNKRQNLLFSATFSNDIRDLAARLLDDPTEIEVAARNKTADRVEQVVYTVDKVRKREMLSEMIGRGNWRQVLVFTRTKHGANRLATQLSKDGIESSAIHGGKGQGARTRALRDFKNGQVRVLVATDIAARGLDIDKLPHVVNFELPFVAEDYVHRIGRTARAGHDGTAVSLVCIDEAKLLKDIERLLGRKLKSVVMPGYEVDKSIKAEPLRQGGGGNKPRGNRRSGGGAGKPGSGKPGAGKPGAGRRGNAGGKKPGGKRPAGKRSGGQRRRG